MRVHHLNCASICPKALPTVPKLMVCHCLLIEANDRLILVDTGLGTLDIQNPKKRLGPSKKLMSFKLDVQETAIRQIQALGYSAHDVRDILLTHLDFDHAGGLSDFPQARIHIFGPEYVAAMAPASIKEKLRYRKIMWAHSPSWVIHPNEDSHESEKWFGFDKVSGLEGLPPEILLVPLKGHTWGHCGIAVKISKNWLLHAGDAYFFHKEMDTEKPNCPKPLVALQNILQVDKNMRVLNQHRLRDLKRQFGAEVNIFSAHDQEEFARLSKVQQF